jgi:hypothetical protein
MLPGTAQFCQYYNVVTQLAMSLLAVQFIPLLYRLSTGDCQFNWMNLFAAAAPDYINNRVNTQFTLHHIVNSINTVPSLIACDGLWLPQPIDCWFLRLFVVPIKQNISD